MKRALRLVFLLAGMVVGFPVLGAESPPADLTPKTPAAFFNRGAGLYCRDDVPQAKKIVETGLEQFPNDGALTELRKLLEQQQDQQKQSSQDQQQQKNQQNQQDQQNQQNQQDSSPNDESGQKKPEPPDSSKSGTPSQPEEAPPKSGEPPAGEKPQKGELSKDELERLLQAAENEELELRDLLRRRTPPSPPVDKNW